MKKQHGAATVETIIFIPFIFILTFITLEMTNFLRIYNAVSWVTEYGVRQASEGMDTGGQRYSQEVAKEKIVLKLFDFNIFNTDYKVCIDYAQTWEDMSSEPSYCNDVHYADLGSFAKSGDLVRVSVTIPYKPMLPNLPYIGDWISDFPLRTTFTRVISSDYNP